MKQNPLPIASSLLAGTMSFWLRARRALGAAPLVWAMALLAPLSNAAGVQVLHHEVAADVVEEVHTVVTGPGAHDKIRIHHVFGQHDGRGPWKSKHSIFLVHGDIWGFDAAFMAGSQSSPALPVFLARRGIDVWGIDLAWTLVPPDTADLSFMADWGLRHDLDDIATGLQFARERREAEGNGRGGMALLGWSRGGQMGYAFLNEEAKRAPHHRQVTGFVAADIYFKTDNPKARAFECANADAFQAAVSQGFPAQDSGDFFQQLGGLSESAPDAVSSLFGPPFTNRSASLTLGAALFQFGESFAPWYHFVSGVFPGNDITATPTALRVTDVTRWDALLVGASRYQPNRLLAEASAIVCDAKPSRFDDHLRDIHVPVLYVGAAGGFGTYGLFTLKLLGSNRVDRHVVRLLPPGSEAMDFGHADLWHARDAQTLLWDRIFRWLRSHADQR